MWNAKIGNSEHREALQQAQPTNHFFQEGCHQPRGQRFVNIDDDDDHDYDEASLSEKAGIQKS